jgi:hypothetical protein
LVDKVFELWFLFQPKPNRITGKYSAILESTLGRVAAERLKDARVGFTSAQS